MAGAAVLKYDTNDAERVQRLRAAGLSFETIANRTGMSPMSAWRMLNGARAVDRGAEITITKAVR